MALPIRYTLRELPGDEAHHSEKRYLGAVYVHDLCGGKYLKMADGHVKISTKTYTEWKSIAIL